MTKPKHDQLSSHRWLEIIMTSVLLFFLSLTLYGHSSIKISVDLSYYLAVSQNVYKSQGFVNAAALTQYDRPGFILILAGIIWLFDGSLSAVMGVIECVASLFVVLIFQLGFRLYGTGVGLLSALLFLGTPRLVFFVPRHIDPFWSVVLLASLLLLLSRSPRERISSLSSGILAALAFFIKEVAVLFLPLPILLAAVKSLPGTARRRSLWFYVGAVGPLLFWLGAGYLGRSCSGESSLVSQTYRTAFQVLFDLGWAGLVHAAIMVVRGFLRYFATPEAGLGLFGQIPVSPLMLASFLWVSREAWRGDLSARVLVMVFVVSLPFLAVIGEYGLRLSQNLVTLGVLFISFAWAILRTVGFLAERLGRFGYQPGWGKIYLTGAFLMVIMASNVLLDKEMRRLVFHRYSNYPSKNTIPESDQNVKEWLSSRLPTIKDFFAGRPKGIFFPGQSLVLWLETKEEANVSLMVDDSRLAHGIYWFSQGKLTIVMLPYWTVSDKIGVDRSPAAPGDPTKIIGIIPNFKKINNYLFSVLLIDKDRLYKEIIQRQVRYLVVSQDNRVLQAWLLAHGGFQREATLADSSTYLVFRVLDNFREVSLQPELVLIPAKMVILLRILKDNSPPRYDWYKKRLFQQLMGFDEGTVASLVEGKESSCYRIIQ